MTLMSNSLDIAPMIEGLAARQALGPVGLIVLDIVGLEQIERRRGKLYGDHLLLQLRHAVTQMQQAQAELFASFHLGADLYVLAHFPQTDEREAAALLAEKAGGIRLHTERKLRETMRPDEGELRLKAGSAVIPDCGGQGAASALYSAVKRALREASRRSTAAEEGGMDRELTDILAGRKIRTVFQPIVSLADGSVFGYEALTRGPDGSPLHTPLRLFEHASGTGRLHTLDRLAREKAIEGFRPKHERQKVFINIPAQVIHDPQFTPGQTLKLLQRYGIRPHQIVFEITERSSIEDFETAKKILRHYRNQGYQIAIDDAGAGYSSLQSIAELQPDYVKIDRSLIERVDKERTKEHLLETFVSFARKMNIRLVAEGIERREELMKVAQLGIHFAQGYLLGRPHAEPTVPDGELLRLIDGYHRLMSVSGSSLRIGVLGASVTTFDWREPISTVASLFRDHEEEQGAVIVREQKPIGLIMREKLFQQLAGQYGVSLFWNRPIHQLMDPHPLIVDESMPVEQVSQMAMSRDSGKLYDYVIISREGQIAGATSVRDILERITHERMEQARVSNPLTGLPGNRQIQRELRRRIEAGKPFSVIYADLDYFKWYNDRYGFQRGDELIQFTAEAMQQALRDSGGDNDFLGHIGGDDFILITESGEPEQLCERVISLFESGVRDFLCESPGPVLDREGRQAQAQGVSVSLSLVVCSRCDGLSPESISEAAAQLKKRAKSQPGSVYICGYLQPAGQAAESTTQQ